MSKRLIRNISLAAISLLTTASNMSAEEQGRTLQECIDEALAGSYQMQVAKANEQLSDVELKEARAAWQPTLSFSTSQKYGNHPYATDKNTYSGSYNLGAGWTVLDGSRQPKIKQAKTNRQLAAEDVRLTQNTLIEDVLNLYMLILEGDEAVNVQKSSCDALRAQRDRSKALYEAGSISISDYTQVESQYSSQNYSLVSAQNTVRDYRMRLCQLMNIEPDLELAISKRNYDDDMILSPLPSYYDVFQSALAIRPEVRSARLSVENARLSIKSAKSGYYPSLSLSASVGTANGEPNDELLTEQFKGNWGNSAGLSLNVPILSGRKNKSAVEKAKLKKTIAEYDLDNTKDKLLYEIEKLWLNAINAQENYKAAKIKADAVQQSYDLVKEQFESGLKNPTDLLTQRNELLSAQLSLLQAKYTVAYSVNMLRHYAGQQML